MRLDAPAHPSPNAGVAEAAFAAALGVRLGGESRYGELVELRPPLNSAAGAGPRRPDIEAAVRLSEQVTFLLGAVLAGMGVASPAVRRRSRGNRRRRG